VIIQAIILGIVQGLTEFLPISSSAHLVVIPWLFGWNDPAVTSLSFDVALHLGTLLAVIVYFFKDWVRFIGAWGKSIIQRKIGDDHDRKVGWFLLLACIPGGLAGFLFEGLIDSSYHSAPIPAVALLVMAGLIAVMGIVLWLVDKLASRERPFEKITIKDAIIIGLAQALAIFPGVSRSGATITAGRVLGLDRVSAARFSFLLSAPIIAGVGLKSALDLVKQVHTGGITQPELIVFPIGFVAAAVSGFLCIKLLLAFLKKFSFVGFAAYRLAFAVLIVVVVLVRM
jgi:undecaprenyl-diphosphatase